MKDLVTHIEAAQKGDLVAYEAIVREFQDLAYGCAFAVLGDFHLAQDVAQEAFIEAYRKLSDLREPGAFPGWFRRIVLSQCSQLTRKKRLSDVPLDQAMAVMSGGGPDRELERKETKDKVMDAIQSLPESQRIATTLYYINGYSQAEVAEFLEVSVSAVKKRIHDSRRRLKERMFEMVDETLKNRPLPVGFADMVIRSAASDEDLNRAAKLLSVHGPLRSIESAEEGGLYVVGEEGQVDGAGYFKETLIGIGATAVKAVRPSEMGGESRGVPDPVFVKSFEACFQLAKRKGIPVAVVHGSQYDHGFCGFVPCFYYPVVTLACETATAIRSRANISKATSAQAKAARNARMADPYAVKMSAFIGHYTSHVIKRDSRVVGYVGLDHKFDPAKHFGMPFGHADDMIPTRGDRDMALSVIRYTGELSREAGQEEIWLMQSHMTQVAQTMLSLGGKYLLRPSCDLVGLDAEMVAILDLALLTRKLRKDFQARLSDSLAKDAEGSFSIQMGDQIVGFVVESGRLKLESTPQKVNRVLPRWVVTRLYMGYYSGEEVLSMGPLPYDRSDGQRADDQQLDGTTLTLPKSVATLFAILFPKMWPCSTPDPDVWPWVIGEQHPGYQHEEGKTADMKARIDDLRFPWIGY